MDQRHIDQINSYGFDVYMRDPEDTYLLFTDGERIGYFEDGRYGISISTVHKPNTRTGTGFQIERHISSFTEDMLLRAFSFAPEWARGELKSVHKYKSMEDYLKTDDWQAGYKLVRLRPDAASGA